MSEANGAPELSWHLSPSLTMSGAAPQAAFEVKFLLDEAQARAVEARLAGRLVLDPHANPSLGHAYRTTSLYTDTESLDVYRRAGPAGRRKYRIRMYGDSESVYLERKTKVGDRVRKRRVVIPAADLAALAELGDRNDWVGDWFRRQVAARGLRPVCRVSYERVAYIGAVEGSPVRVTFDRVVRGEPAAGWEVLPVNGACQNLLPDRVITEFKFRAAMPTLFKSVVEEFQITPGPASKYRLVMGAAAPAVGREMTHA